MFVIQKKICFCRQASYGHIINTIHYKICKIFHYTNVKTQTLNPEKGKDMTLMSLSFSCSPETFLLDQKDLETCLTSLIKVWVYVLQLLMITYIYHIPLSLQWYAWKGIFQPVFTKKFMIRFPTNVIYKNWFQTLFTIL